MKGTQFVVPGSSLLAAVGGLGGVPGAEVLYDGGVWLTTAPMSTITAGLTPAPDGTLHLPLPEGWGHTAVRVKAERVPVDEPPLSELKTGFGCLKGKIWAPPDFDASLDDFKEYVE